MSFQPFFSVIIPPRNRSAIVPTAIESVLKQTFEDFEVIIVDIDMSETATKEAVAPFLHRDSRVRYVRSGGLSMADNWEFGLDYVTGKYVIYMEDKQVLLRHGLEKLYEIILKNQFCPVVTWRWGTFDIGRYTNFIWQFEPGYEEKILSEEVIRRFAEENLYTYGFPVPHSSAVRLDIIHKIKESKLGRLCSPISPDITAAFAILNYAEHVVFISDALSVMHSKHLGNALRCMQDIKLFEKFLKESHFDSAKWNKDLPVKFHTVPNVGFNDFLFIRDTLGEKLSKYQINPVNYFFQNLQNADYWIKMGVNEYKNIKILFEEKLKETPLEIQQEVKQKMAPITLDKKEHSLPTFLQIPASFIKNRIFSNSQKYKILSRNGRNIVFQKKFNSVNDYLAWEFENYCQNIQYSERQ